MFSTYAVSDAAGAIQERYDYDPYGKVSFFSADLSTTRSASALGVHHLFTGRERDVETGLQLNRNRYYFAPRGRWISRDPIGYQDGMNIYLFTSANPCLYIDPLGTESSSLPRYPHEPWDSHDLSGRFLTHYLHGRGEPFNINSNENTDILESYRGGPDLGGQLC